MKKPLSFDECCTIHGQEPCDSCQYNIIHLARCTYKLGKCVLYDNYVKDFHGDDVVQLNLFGN